MPSAASAGYDLTIYGIVKFFSLAMHNNPNIIDSLFTPVNCILLLHTRGRHRQREPETLLAQRSLVQIQKLPRTAQLHKLSTRAPPGQAGRAHLEHGIDTKFAYHVVRLILEVEQILVEGDIDLQRNHEQLKAVRRGNGPRPPPRLVFPKANRPRTGVR